MQVALCPYPLLRDGSQYGGWWIRSWIGWLEGKSWMFTCCLIRVCEVCNHSGFLWDLPCCICVCRLLSFLCLVLDMRRVVHGLPVGRMIDDGVIVRPVRLILITSTALQRIIFADVVLSLNPSKVFPVSKARSMKIMKCILLWLRLYIQIVTSFLHIFRRVDHFGCNHLNSSLSGTVRHL